MPLDVGDFVAGWVGGAAGVVSSHPLDTVKVRLQTSSVYKNTVDCCLKTVRKEGMPGFFKGMSFPLLSVAAYNALVFGVYSNTTKLICQWRYNDRNRAASYVDMTAAAMVAGGVSVAVGAPVDLIKIRLQAQTEQKTGGKNMLRFAPATGGRQLNERSDLKKFNYVSHRALSSAHARSYGGPVDCILRIYKENGVRGFYRGGGPAMLLRDIPGYVIYFIPYAVMCKLFESKSEGRAGPLGLVMAGGFAGVLSWGMMHPVDTIKSRLQVNPQAYKGVWDCVSSSYKSEGLGVFFRGLSVNALRGFPQSGALFLGYEMSMRMIRED